MTGKGSRNQTTTVEAQTPKPNGTAATTTTNTDSAASDLPSNNADEEGHSYHNVDQAAAAALSGNSQSGRITKGIRLDVQSLALVAALVAIPLAYWQGTIQASDSKFERNQRVVELSLNLGVFWEAQLDSDTRFRTGRFVAKLNSLKTDEEKRTLVNSLLDPNNLLEVSADPKNQLLLELIKPDISCDSPECATIPPVVAVAKYRAAVMKTLNTMEEIAIVREHSKELREAVKVIDRAYAGAIQQKYKDLSPFVEEYHKKTDKGRETPAWQPLTKMVDEADERLRRSEEARP